MSIRDEARREYVRRAIGPSVGTIADRLSAAWEAGAEWERAHLAAQEESVLMTSREETISDRLSDAGYTEYAEDEDGGVTWVSAPLGEVLRIVSAAQEPTDAEKAVRELHRPAQVYTLAEDCTEPEAHEWSTASHGGDELCLNEPTGQQFCTECCPEDAFDCTDYPYPCPTIQAFDSARAARRDEEKRDG